MGNSGDHTSLWPWGKNQGEKGGRGGQLTRGLWLCPGKNNREGPSEGPQLPHLPTITHMHIQSTERGAQYILSSKSMFQQSQKNLSCSRVFCITRQCIFNFFLLMDSLIYKISPHPRKDHTMLVAADVTPKNAL